MKRKVEKNISEFNKDVNAHGRYVYTDQTVYSLFTARKRQFDVIIETITENFDKKINILDVGCGDGTFVFQLWKTLKPKYIMGVDAAKQAVDSAKKRIPSKIKNKISFKQV